MSKLYSFYGGKVLWKKLGKERQSAGWDGDGSGWFVIFNGAGKVGIIEKVTFEEWSEGR